MGLRKVASGGSIPEGLSKKSTQLYNYF